MKKKDTFITIRFKRETAKRFQEFSKKHFKTHTEAMASMLDFFLYNEISPKEKFGPTGRTIVNLSQFETPCSLAQRIVLRTITLARAQFLYGTLTAIVSFDTADIKING